LGGRERRGKIFIGRERKEAVEMGKAVGRSRWKKEEGKEKEKKRKEYKLLK